MGELGAWLAAYPALGWWLGVTFARRGFPLHGPDPRKSMALNSLDLATALVDHGSFELDEHCGVDVAVRNSQILSGMPPGACFIATVVYVLFTSCSGA